MTCYRTCRLAISYIMLITVFVHSKNLENFGEEENPKMTDQFVIKVEGGPEVAKHLARKHGFIYLNRIIGDFYHLKQKKVTKRSLSSTIRERAALKNEPMVQYFEQQVAKRRVKRDFRADATSTPIPSADQLTKLNDPRWTLMWYLNRGNDLDMNVQAAWAQGITGKGIVVTILDDGLEKDHPDIIENYDEDASYDVNNHDGDPQPRYDIIDSNRHGTRCAGEVAATANNSICAVGIAYHAKVGGVRMLDGDVTDAVEAQSLSLNSNHVDIYSASWGPDDDGKTVDGPGPLASTAFKEGILKGRHGLGSIFVWASGNGGREHDNCNCDGYTNSMWTLSISSATENGLVPWYSEACSSTLATTYSSGANGEKQIVTTDLHHGCTSTHTGTSASAPLAAGICALALEANKKLTWRDMQHIVVRAARPANLHAKDWAVNGVGRNVSHSFGYGLMDANAMVNLAQKWKTAPVQKLCEIKSSQQDQLIPAKSHVKLTLYVRCSNVRYLEHVQAKVSLSASRRGDVHVYLTSPMGTRSTLLAQRPLDGSRAGFQSWPFMTVHNWGEDPDGLWTLEVHNEGRYYGRGTLKEWYLHLYGTTENPDGFRKTTTTTTTTVPTSTTAETTTIFSTPNATIVSLKPIPQSTKLKAPPWPQPTVQYYPTTSTTKYPPYSLEDGRHMEGDNKITPANRKVAAQETGCPKGNFFYHGHCVRQCPSGHYGSVGYNYRSSTSQELTTSTCLRCHYSCIECHGPNDYQCVLCHGDALLIDGYCEPKLLVDEVHTLSVWNHVVIGVFTALCVLTVCITVYVLVSFWPPPCSSVWCCKGTRKNRRDFASMQPHSQRREQARTFLPMTSQACGSSNNHDRNVRLKPYYDTDEDL